MFKLRFIAVGFFSLAICGCDPLTPFDSNKPDTENNLAGYQRHLGIAPTADVTGVYYFAKDAIDPIYMLRFEADVSTVDIIINTLGLSSGALPWEPGSFGKNLEWWPDDRIVQIDPVWKTNPEESYYWMLWHDPEQREVFFIEFFAY